MSALAHAIDPFSVETTLEDAAHSKRTGELVIQKESLSGRVFFVEGSVAWAHCEGHNGFLLDRLVSRNGLAREDLMSLLRECRAEGRQFGDYLVDLGLVSSDDMRQALLEHVQDQLQTILQTSGEARSLFVPVSRKFTSRFAFDLGEVMTTPVSSARAHAAAEQTDRKSIDMASISESLDEVLKINGAFAAALVDHGSGMTLGTAGGRPDFNIELAAAGNTDVVRAKMAVMKSLGITGGIEDILISLSDQYHLIRPLKNNESLFLYVAIAKDGGNLGLARHKLADIEKALSV